MTAAAYRGWGIAFAVLGVLAFSLRPILIKLSYAAHPVSPTTLLFLRMTLSLPFFLAIGWWLRMQQPRLTRTDWPSGAKEVVEVKEIDREITVTEGRR